MADIITEPSDARAMLKLWAATDSTPSLTDEPEGESELDLILRCNKRASVWEAGTKYKLGDRILPTSENRTGRMLKCVRVGTSGTEEPDWLPSSGYASGIVGGLLVGNMGSGAAVVPDGSAAWVDDGKEEDLWDIGEAISDAWMARAGKAAELHALSRGGNTYDFGRIHDHCLAMAGNFGGAFIR